MLETDDQIEGETPVGPSEEGDNSPESEQRLVQEIIERIKTDKQRYKTKFDRMRTDMHIARRGADKTRGKDLYTANITGRHINQSVAALYARNPKAIARRRERLDFQVWDETQESLITAMQVAQTAQGMAPDPLTGMTAAFMDPMVQQSVAIVQDFQQGMQQRENAKRIGKTMELLFDYFTKEQTPVDFKTSMKQLVRRAKTTGVGYLKIGFQREYQDNPAVAERLADFRTQIRHTDDLIMQVEKGEDMGDLEARKAELEASIRSLQEQQEVLIREGLVFDFPGSTRVIPDKLCQQVTGFVGCRWITVEYPYTPAEVREVFGVDLNKGEYKPMYDVVDGDDDDEDAAVDENAKTTEGLVCVWEHFDRASGTVYYVCDGHKSFLRPPAAPDVYVEEFWPVYALTFNEVEDPQHPIPPSDVELMEDMQKDYNDARQGQREHRGAARPRFLTRTGVMSDEAKQALRDLDPFDVAEIDTDEEDIRKVFAPIPVPGVDPNLYETNQMMTDIQLAIGAQEAQFGAVAKATATESSIAESSRVASVDSNVDDLDAFLTRVAKASGQVLLQEMSLEMVQEIAGPGALWPEASLEEVVKEIYLEVEAGSSGKPNQAQEIRNWREMLPFIIQIPGLDPVWLLRESLRRLDDRMDLTEALNANVPSILTMNRMQQSQPADPNADPQAQGEEGANNGPAAPGGPTGSDAAMGNNQVP